MTVTTADITQNIEPMGIWILVQVHKEKIATPVGIQIPEAAKKSFTLLIVKVLKCADFFYTYDGNQIPIEVKPGDYAVIKPGANLFAVHYPQITGASEDGVIPESLLLNYEDVMGKYTPSDDE